MFKKNYLNDDSINFYWYFLGVFIIICLNYYKLSLLNSIGVDYHNLVIDEASKSNYIYFTSDEIKYIKWFESRAFLYIDNIKSGGFSGYFNLWGFIVSALVILFDYNLVSVFILGLISYTVFFFTIKKIFSGRCYKNLRFSIILLVLNPYVLSLGSGALRDLLIFSFFLLSLFYFHKNNIFKSFVFLLLLFLLRGWWSGMLFLYFSSYLFNFRFSSRIVLFFFFMVGISFLGFSFLSGFSWYLFLRSSLELYSGLPISFVSLDINELNFNGVINNLGIFIFACNYFYLLIVNFRLLYKLDDLLLFYVFFILINALFYSMSVGFMDSRIKVFFFIFFIFMVFFKLKKSCRVY